MEKSIQNLSVLIKRYHELNKEKECIINQIKSLNIDFEELEKLDFDNIQQVRNTLKYLASPDVFQKIDDIYMQRIMALYPNAFKVKYFPEINEIPFLSDEEKIKLDIALHDLKLNHYTYIIKNISKNQEKSKLIQEFLYEKNILEKVYELKCCCSPGKTIKETEYNYLKQQFSLPQNKRDKDFEGYIYIPCDDGCERGKEILTLSDLERCEKSIIYTKKATGSSQNEIFKIADEYLKKLYR